MTQTTLLCCCLALAGGPAVTDDDRAHWAFVTPSRPLIPAVVRADWPTNPVDAFVLAKLEEAGLAPSPEADRLTLVRRLTFGLTGLPPTPEESAAWFADKSPDAYEKLVDRLLASTMHGERWAQHWLDLARHADTDGFEFDQARPDAWRYRDWVVDAINGDLPYDAFLTRQIAGDETGPEGPSAFVATGFLRGYPDMVDLNDQGLRRQHALDDITETTALAFLGLTVGCARCHDHKTDPIPQADYYRLQAFFTPARFRDDFPLGPSARARGVDEAGPQAGPTFVLKRGEYGARGADVAPGFPLVLGHDEAASVARVAPSARSTGRRQALAAWLTRPDHPLTARVFVNRVWQHHFGRGIVATPSDFGLTGEPPTHPELLDWLAAEFVAQGWSVKALHRLIVTSAAYRQSSLASPQGLTVDPENGLFWRQQRHRLDGEALRDALLAVSGRLNLAQHGPPVFPDLPAELATLSNKGAVWPVSPEPFDRDRRSLYVFIRRNLRYPFFEAFDRPDTNASCARRAVTTIAPQALTLLNGRAAREAARALAGRLDREAGPDEVARVDRAYRLALGRPPDAEERRIAAEFLAGDPSWPRLCLALLNLNEFVTVD